MIVEIIGGLALLSLVVIGIRQIPPESEEIIAARERYGKADV